MPLHAILVLLVLLVLPVRSAHCQAHSTPTTVDSWARASALIDSAVAAHGGIDAVRAVRKLQVRIEGQDYHRNQSRRVAAPYDSTPRIVHYFSDLARERMVVEQTTGFPGGFRYTNRFVSDSARHYAVNVRAQTYSNQQYPPASQQYGNLFQVPQGYLMVAAESAPALRRYIGRTRLSSGAVVDAVVVFFPNTTVTLGFDPTSHRLRSVMGVGMDAFLGDAALDTEFLDYRMIDGVLLPARAQLWRAGEMTREMRYISAAAGQAIPDSLLAPPVGSAVLPPAPAPDPLRVLGPGVWAIRGGGSWQVLVEFADHLMVLDASPNAASTVIRRAAELAPGKPIRYVVPTHHHDDHFGGVRHYTAVGATTVTTAGNVDYFKRIMAAPQSTLLPGQSPPQPSNRLEVLTGKRRVFTDGRRTVEIHEIASPHATEMLVAWLPAEGVLFQGDLIEAPNAIAQRGANAETTTHLAEFIRRQGWQVKEYGGVHGFLTSPQEFEKLVQLPMLPIR
ncbi:MAG: MBL fold metallo-hydrolase [Cytophagaceae bacterium]|nr:MBL fold metallo-hydrolase [Gemmatimonadaceae bacterium]